MSNRNFGLLTTGILVVLTGAAATLATPIIVAGPDTRVNAMAYDGIGGIYQPGAVFPAGYGTGSVTRTAGHSSVTTAYDYSVAGNVVTLAHDFNQHIDARPPATTGTYNHEEDAMSSGSVDFTLEAGDIGYTYAVDARTEQDGTSRLYLLASLYDLTLNGGPLHFQAENTVSTDAYIQSGDTHQPIGGSLTGNLIAGHTYRFSYSTWIQHWSIGEGAWTNPLGYTPTDAEGHINLTLSGPAPVEAVPEPSSLALMGLGFGAFAFLARRRRG